jgi:phosphoribosylformylglycinamidine cyclo-ligase
MSQAYREAGVDLEKADAIVDIVKPHAKRTHRSGVMGGVGGFAGLFDVSFLKNYQHPLLVSSADGVGSKLLLAIDQNNHRQIGVDLVAMNVNDLLTCGAEPLFFFDYVAVHQIDLKHFDEVVGGIATGCEQAGCALLGGETAEMPRLYSPSHYDLAGFAVGVVEADQRIDGSHIKAGDVVIGLSSSGVHSNGYALIHRLIEKYQWDTKAPLSGDPHGRTLGEALLEPTRIYVKTIQALLKQMPGVVKGMAHVTGGGLAGNLERPLSADLMAILMEDQWQKPAVFKKLLSDSGVSKADLFETFNMGIGFCVVVEKFQAQSVLRFLAACGEMAWEVGYIAERASDAPRVDIRWANE